MIVIGWILTIVACIGMFKFFQGTMDLVSSQDSENSKRKEQCIKKIAVGTALILLKVVLT